MSSTASNNGVATINVYFKQGTDADMAAVNVQNRVARATSLLPSEVTRAGVITAKRQNSVITSYSIHYTKLYDSISKASPPILYSPNKFTWNFPARSLSFTPTKFLNTWLLAMW